VGANLLLITQSSAQNDICFVVQSGDTARAVAALRKALAYDLRHHDVEHITVNPGIAIVAVVGEQMRGTVGVAGRVFSILAGAGVNLIAIAQGSSENNISFVIEEAAVQKTVTAIHRELDLARLGPAGVEPRTQAKA
jgi:aspartate kinase